MKLLIKLKSKKGVIKVKLEKILRPSKFNKRSHSVTSRKKKVTSKIINYRPFLFYEKPFWERLQNDNKSIFIIFKIYLSSASNSQTTQNLSRKINGSRNWLFKQYNNNESGSNYCVTKEFHIDNNLKFLEISK